MPGRFTKVMRRGVMKGKVGSAEGGRVEHRGAHVGDSVGARRETVPKNQGTADGQIESPMRAPRSPKNRNTKAG